MSKDTQNGMFGAHDSLGAFPVESEITRLVLGRQPIFVTHADIARGGTHYEMPAGTNWSPPGQAQPWYEANYSDQSYVNGNGQSCVDGNCIDQQDFDPNSIDQVRLDSRVLEFLAQNYAPGTTGGLNPRFYLSAQRNMIGCQPGMSPQCQFQPGRISPQQAATYQILRLVTGGGDCPQQYFPQTYDPRYPQYDPRYPQYDPRFPQQYFPQTYDPRYPQYDPRYPQYDPRFPQQYDPRYPQYDPRYPQYDPRYPYPQPHRPGCYPDGGSTTNQILRFALPFILSQIGRNSHYDNRNYAFQGRPVYPGGYSPMRGYMPGGCHSGIGINIGGARINFGDFGNMGRHQSSMRNFNQTYAMMSRHMRQSGRGHCR